MNRNCNYCDKEYTAQRKTSKYCSGTCRTRNFLKEQKEQLKEVIEEVKIDYPKMTFRLSVFGFMASIAFYLGVLRDLGQPKDKSVQKIEQLEQENTKLKRTVELLVEELRENETEKSK